MHDERLLISDLREDNFRIEKGLARAVLEEDLVKDYYKWSSKNRDYDVALKERIQEPLKYGHLITKNSEGEIIFDDRKLRYSGHNKDSKGYILEIAPTHFGEFRDFDLRAFSDKNYFEKLRKKGALDYNDPQAYFSNCLAINALPILSDGSVVLLKRNEKSEVFPGHWHVIAGMLDTDLTLFSKENPQKKLINEIYNTIEKEFVEEASILDTKIKIQGLVKNVPGTCDFSCTANLNINFEDFINLNKNAKDKSEHTSMIQLKTKEELYNFMLAEKITHSGFSTMQIYLDS